ncbi:MAG: Flp pilus assembly complex ATPase component TadA, partial [Candidatus Omnitrophica bacterium]|nr:Flp pilus assembly complex ATPase component TadA [Candidatus Omnitrophota bacterium]
MLSLKERLTELLITNRLITPEQLQQALQVQREKGGRLRDILVELRFVKEREFAPIISEGLGLPLIDLKRIKIDPTITGLVPVAIAHHYQIIPVSKMGESITIAMVDPLNVFAIDHLKSLTGYTINPIISTSQDIQQAIQLYYPDTTTGVIEGIVKEMSEPVLDVIKEEKEVAPSDYELIQSSREAPVIQVTNVILEEAIKKKASDILVEPFERRIRVRFRIDGILQEQESPPKLMHAAIVSRIKVISDLNIAEHRLPQDGRCKLLVSGREVDFRISIVPSSYGEKVAVRILDKTQATLDIDRLGFSEDTIKNLKVASKLPHGMLLVCGPTGSGKTTTLYSLIKFIDSPEKNIVTVEDPVEYQLEGINQVTARLEIGLT